MNKQFGWVKWFGGRNNKTGKDNDFGFVESLGGEPAFLHKSEYVGSSLPAEGDVLVYERVARAGKYIASNAAKLSQSDVSVFEVFLALQKFTISAGGGYIHPALKPIMKDFLKRLLLAGDDQLEHIKSSSTRYSVFELLYRYGYSNGEAECRPCFERLTKSNGASVWRQVPLRYVPTSLISLNVEAIAAYLGELECAEAKAQISDRLDVIPPSLLVFLLIKGILSSEEISSQHGRLSSYLETMFDANTKPLPPYVKTAYENILKPKGGYRACPMLWKIVEPFLFKQYLFEKNQRFLLLYENSAALQGNLETFVLFNILSLHRAGNLPSEIIPIFTQRLWDELLSRRLSLDSQVVNIFKLFPAHGFSTKNELSCEAVFWKTSGSSFNDGKYLCRGKECSRPKILPDLTKHYLKFNLFDWLAHYGIDYSEEKRPSNKDFSVKLAGYFNRLREIWPVLHCRECANVMLPDFRYSRTEYKDYENGEVVVKEMAAAYRLTVFSCNHESCAEYKTGYYINHCMGMGCYHIIDARDLEVQCEEGRYVCKGCGSCCLKHATEKPVGICGGCGQGLRLFEGLPIEYANGKSYGKKERFARCEDSCGFEVPTPLPQKFYLPTCQPVYKEPAQAD